MRIYKSCYIIGQSNMATTTKFKKSLDFILFRAILRSQQNGEGTDFLCTLALHMHSLPHCQHLPQSGTYVITDEPALTRVITQCS